MKTSPAVESLKPIRFTLDLDPAMHRRLKIQALQTGKKAAEVVRELIDTNCPDHDSWFREQVKLGQADAKAGRVISHAKAKRRNAARIARLEG